MCDQPLDPGNVDGWKGQPMTRRMMSLEAYTEGENIVSILP
jgi:hypothetical protein